MDISNQWLIIAAIVLFFVAACFAFKQSPQEKGRRGENKAQDKLEFLANRGMPGKILRNTYLPTGNGKTVEIDLMYITVKGIFVIESKNYAGYIFGNEKNKNWTVTLYGGKNFIGFKKVEKHHFYNPIWQNRTHINCLKRAIGTDVKCISIVAFDDRGELKSITCHTPDTSVIYTSNLYGEIRKYWDALPDSISEEEVNRIYTDILPKSKVEDEIKNKHIVEVEKKRNNYADSALNSTEQIVSTCPLCGGKLVVRTAKKGPTAGSQFYGCSNYPECRYTRKK